jgi:hypothetical protein
MGIKTPPKHGVFSLLYHGIRKRSKKNDAYKAKRPEKRAISLTTRKMPFVFKGTGYLFLFRFLSVLLEETKQGYIARNNPIYTNSL